MSVIESVDVKTIEMKRLWEVQIDLLEALKRVCQKYGLRYYAAGGTLLGAARHRGFIPWDDDLDVQMMWSDYKILMEVATEEFQYPYYFQSYQNDPFGEVSNSRLRRSDTTGYTEWEHENIKIPDHNRGIFIDIFPLFPIPKSGEARLDAKDKIMQLWKAMRGWNAIQNHIAGYPSKYDIYIKDYESIKSNYSIFEIKQQFMDLCADVQDDYDEIGETSFKTFDEKYIWKKEWFDDVVEAPFEDTSISCPCCYDEILTKQYGNWRVPVRGGACHQMHCYDVKISYEEYANMNLEG